MEEYHKILCDGMVSRAKRRCTGDKWNGYIPHFSTFYAKIIECIIDKAKTGENTINIDLLELAGKFQVNPNEIPVGAIRDALEFDFFDPEDDIEHRTVFTSSYVFNLILTSEQVLKLIYQWVHSSEEVNLYILWGKNPQFGYYPRDPERRAQFREAAMERHRHNVDFPPDWVYNPCSIASFVKEDLLK